MHLRVRSPVCCDPRQRQQAILQHLTCHSMLHERPRHNFADLCGLDRANDRPWTQPIPVICHGDSHCRHWACQASPKGRGAECENCGRAASRRSCRCGLACDMTRRKVAGSPPHDDDVSPSYTCPARDIAGRCCHGIIAIWRYVDHGSRCR